MLYRVTSIDAQTDWLLKEVFTTSPTPTDERASVTVVLKWMERLLSWTSLIGAFESNQTNLSNETLLFVRGMLQKISHLKSETEVLSTNNKGVLVYSSWNKNTLIILNRSNCAGHLSVVWRLDARSPNLDCV